ncbi:alpha/beta hydrolase [Skermania sp. ID1734]|uniref:lipase family alpha/beta hydrolase n=1 Tax=Skermania sp. ID1734 TaxID=2597516 RepID=UPI00117C79B3|nr:alpha/beta fold hydrolase [Skermania sp. ID1734]TSE00370.1 alpha/beta hydrolase [Skermania sp. ID1734]
MREQNLRRSETRAMAKLALEELAGSVDGIAKVHHAVSGRVFTGLRFAGLGKATKPVQTTHDIISTGIYRAVGVTARTMGEAAGRTVDVPLEVAPSETVRGAALLGVLQGLRGDALDAEGSMLASPMTVRHNGAAVAIEKTALAATYPNATGRIVIFLHGLMETEHAWRIGGRPSYAERLPGDIGATCVQIRYNSGRHISHNGAELADLLTKLVREWPVDVESLALVGHSMGGLVVRSACYRASGERQPWVRKVTHVVSLGSPHTGAPLERIVHYGSAALVRLPETRPFGRLLRRRSAGIRDLRQGSLVDADWTDLDIDSLRRVATQEVPLLDGALHFFVTACIARSPRNPLGRLIGDGLVMVPSASGRSRSRRIGFRDEDGMHLPGANHFTLLNNEAVYDQLVRWLQTSPAKELTA